jgi:hypothetical protein
MPEVNDDQIELRAQNNGPRVTAEDITRLIKQEQYWQVPGTTVTVCCLTLENGFSVVGHGACISPENYDAVLGRDIAYTEARNKIWELQGYLRKQQLFERYTDTIHAKLSDGNDPFPTEPFIEHTDQHL